MAFGKRSTETVDVFIVDADASQRRVLAGLIEDRAVGRFQPRVCSHLDEAFAATGGARAIMIADLDTIGGTGRLSEIARTAPLLIATSATSSMSTAIAAVRAGAIDFLPKPIGARALMERLEAAVATLRPIQGTTPATPAPATEPTSGDFAGFVGRSPPMVELYRLIRRVAPSRAPVFITGESGTGKEVCAEAIHQSAGGPDRPFVAINCSAIPKDLMESEIFGHVRGAFTGAADDRPGAAELADGGTLFLDEIAEMDLGLQAKLLRFVQTGTLRRVGGRQLMEVDVRLIAATNRDPFAEVEAGRFRADLFYRLHVLPIHLAPLCQRREDVMPLANAFLARYAAEEGRAFHRISPEAADFLASCSWPGNVRQLQNVIRRIVVLHEGEEVTVGMLPSMPDRGEGPKVVAAASTANGEAGRVQPFWQQERDIIETALARHGGNIARAAAALEINPSTIYRKRQAWSARLRA